VRADVVGASPSRAATRRRWPWVAALAVGVGLIAAPAVFEMFSRAPKGGHMIHAFRPYMTEAKISGFEHDLTEIDAAVTEAGARLQPRLATATPNLASRYPSYVTFRDQWPGIDADMTNMLTTMRRDVGDFRAVDAHPPFPLFPWFFVVPGALVAGVSTFALAHPQDSRQAGRRALVVALGLGLIAAPAVFQMFGRAPKGSHMIDDFRPLMTTAKVQRVQGYFLVIGAGEGTLRTEMLPAAAAVTGASTSEVRTQFPAEYAFSADWPTISNTMAPMIGAMSDNLGNYAGVAALPPFWLFPWFFVLPGIALVLLAFVNPSRGRASADPIRSVA